MRRKADLSEQQMQALRPVGYWPIEAPTGEVAIRRYGRTTAAPKVPLSANLPDPTTLADAHWDEVERARVVAYLDRAYAMGYSCMGYSWCRFRCGVPDQQMGHNDHTDGTWIFPEGYVHYVKLHAVKPPEDFLAHLRTLDFSMPSLPVCKDGEPSIWAARCPYCDACLNTNKAQQCFDCGMDWHDPKNPRLLGQSQEVLAKQEARASPNQPAKRWWWPWS